MKKLLVLALLLAFVGAVQAETLFYTEWGATGGVRQVSLTGTAISSFAFANAMGIALNGAGNLLLTDTTTNKVSEWTTTGTQLQAAYYGSGPYSLNGPQGIAWRNEGTQGGTVYIAINNASRMAKYNADWSAIGWVGPLYDNWGTTQSGFTKSYPFGVAVNQSTGDIYASVMMQYPNYNTGVVLKTSAAGWGATVTQSVFFTPPTATDGLGGVAVDASGNVWVADTTLDVIYKLSSAGALLQTISTGGNNDPRGMAFDSAGNLYVAENRTNRLDVFTAASGYLTKTTLVQLAGVQTINFLQIVPEPATLVLLGLGALTLIRRRK